MQHASGNIALQLLPATELPSRIVDVLPPNHPGPGKNVEIDISDPNRPSWEIRDPWKPTLAEQFLNRYRKPLRGSIHIAVYPWGSPDNRHEDGRQDFQILDIVDEGRYALSGTTVLTFRPVTDQQITTTITALLDQTIMAVRRGGFHVS